MTPDNILADPYAAADTAAARLRELTGAETHDVALVMGSGWAPAAEALGAPAAEFPFTELPSQPSLTSAHQRYDTLVSTLTGAGFDILVADFTPPGHASHSVKVIVPGIEVETMSYHRIGERGVKKLLARGDALAGLGAPPEGAHRVHLTAEAEARLGGPAWFHTRLAKRKLGGLYALYREPERHAAQLLLRQRRHGGGLS